MAVRDYFPRAARGGAAGFLLFGVLLGVAVCGANARGCGGDGKSGAGGPAPDPACLHVLRKAGVAFVPAESTPGIRTPVVIRGAIDGVRLIPRGRREALMDCALARGLLEAAPVFRGFGIDGLEYSAAYDYRPRRGTDKLSAHANGLAIDVHVLRDGSRRYDVARAFETGTGEWRQLRAGPGALAACIGSPRTEPGRLLRGLACRLKLHTSFRILVTPDDNADHRDHFHLEVYPDETPPPPLTG